MPFKPRIVRFDDEHAAVPAPAGGGPSAPLGAALIAAVDAPSSVVETPSTDPTHDTIRGEAFDTLADWDPDDALLNDPMMQCLARQLSDDAERLARRYPAEGWVAPSVDERPALPPPVARRGLLRRGFFRRLVAVAAALGACYLATLGPLPIGSRSALDAPDVVSENDAETESLPPLPVDRVTYEDGDAAIWGTSPIDDSQFGDVQFGVLRFGDGDAAEGGAFDVLSRPAHEALRELLPADSHEYCDVSM